MAEGYVTCEKVYRDIPFAHRQHNHDGHCAFIHGHNWTLRFVFGCKEVDENGFVVDFGKLRPVKDWIEKHLDHALLLNQDDPYRSYLEHFLVGSNINEQMEDFAKIHIVPNGSSEGLAEYFYDVFNPMIKELTDGRVYLMDVEVREDSKNSATFRALAF